MNFKIYNRRDFLSIVPFAFSIQIKKCIEIIVEERNNVEIIYLEEKKLNELFHDLIKLYPFADCFEINYNPKQKYLLKKHQNIIPLIFGGVLWIIQNWDYTNKTWNQNGELFCFSF